MCTDCGCGLPGENPPTFSNPKHPHDHPHSHDEDHVHAHPHSHGDGHVHSHPHSHDEGHIHDHHHPHSHEADQIHDHSHADPQTPAPAPGLPQDDPRRTLNVRRAILEKNDRLAERNRGFFLGRGLLALNVLSAPGSGKTTFLRETLRALPPPLRAGVIVGDLATDNDAQRLRDTGAPVVQITTGTVCHLEAEMVARALGQLDLSGLNVLIIENVGNLVCPASYDLGEHLRVVLLSVTEGEDKPLKYPPMFQAADVVILSKSDLAEVCGCDRAAVRQNLRQIAPNATVFELSARTGAGMPDWINFLVQKHRVMTDSAPKHP